MSIRLHVRLGRRLSHRLSRSCSRRLNRPLGGRAPNYLGQALAAFGRAVRAHRRLIKLAPERFDVAVRDRLARERAAEDQRLNQWAAEIAKVYGVSEAEAVKQMHQGRNGAETVRKSSAREREVERWQGKLESWLAIGQEAFDWHETLTPHRWLSLGTIARLLDLSSSLGRLSTGMKEHPG